MESRTIIDFSVTSLPFRNQIDIMMQWATENLSKVVCIANVHMLIEGHRNAQFGRVLRGADLVTPDGMPLVWILKIMGAAQQDRVAGVDVLEGLCQSAVQHGVSIFFVGSQQSILSKMEDRLNREFPGLRIACMRPLPFRPLTLEEDEDLIHDINQSGAGIVFISLGCPKQETWMANHKGKIEAVMVGLGGAFPVYAGIHRRAPKAVRQAGLEWLYRLFQEPRRLWRRYMTTIPVFLWLIIKQLIISRKNPSCKYFH